MRRFRVPDLIDPELWSRAGWSRIAYIAPLDRPPVLVLVFNDLDIARAIFTTWNTTLGEIDFDDLVRVAIIEDDRSDGRAMCHVHLSIDPRSTSKAAARRGAHLVEQTDAHADVWCHMLAAIGWLQRFRDHLDEHGRYLVVPGTIDGGLMAIPQLGIGKQRLEFRRAREVLLVDDLDSDLWR